MARIRPVAPLTKKKPAHEHLQSKWLNEHGVELLRRYPQEFRCGTGMTVEEYLQALSVHVDRCRAFLDKM
jgi:hypothetical protein